MRQYHDLLRLVLEEGQPRADRTGTGTLSIFGAQTRFDSDRLLHANLHLLETRHRANLELQQQSQAADPVAESSGPGILPLEHATRSRSGES